MKRLSGPSMVGATPVVARELPAALWRALSIATFAAGTTRTTRATRATGATARIHWSTLTAKTATGATAVTVVIAAGPAAALSAVATAITTTVTTTTIVIPTAGRRILTRASAAITATASPTHASATGAAASTLIFQIGGRGHLTT